MEMQHQVRLEVRSLFKAYRRHQILEDVTFSAASGQCVGIVGSNGCGKTTLLSILAGAVRADKGSIRYRGREAIGAPRVFDQEVAYVPQENPLMWELSVKDNLSLWYRGGRKRMEEDLKNGPAALLGIDKMLKKTVATLSGGMKKRLSIACALSNHASVLILDEPGAALDLEGKAEVRGYVEGYIRSGGTVVLASHEMEELALCTQMYVLKGGKLYPIEAGAPEEKLREAFQM